MAVLTPKRTCFSFTSSASFYPQADPLHLVVESGQGTRGANSYVTVNYASNYFIGRRLYSSAWTIATNDVRLVALKQASALLDTEFEWSGTGPLQTYQGLAWPRVDAVDRDRNVVTGVPKQIKDAVCELAFYLLAEDRLVGQEGVGLKSLRVDVISLVFDKSSSPATYPPHIIRMVSGFGAPLKGTGTIRTVPLTRV